MPTNSKAPAAKQTSTTQAGAVQAGDVPAAAPKAKPLAARKPSNPFVDKHPGKPGRNANGKAHRAGR